MASGLRCGLLGLPNAGKSTLFNALTNAHAPVANYPFTTIDPQVGVVTVPDPRLDQLARLIPHDQLIPTHLEVTDVAGLVEGASKGEGKGNQFLNNLQEVDCLVHVVHLFDDPNVPHYLGVIDSVRDVELIEAELLLKDLEWVERMVEKFAKSAKGGDPKAKAAIAALESWQTSLGQGVPARRWSVTKELSPQTLGLSLLTMKPVVYVANVSEAMVAQPPKPLAALRAWCEREQAPLIVVAGRAEAELQELEPADRSAMRQELGVGETDALGAVVRACYAALRLVTFFTTQSRILQAWTVSEGTAAPQAAGKIHTDFERGFIRAEVMGFDALVQAGSEAAARASGHVRTEGKEYMVRDGDIIHFKVAT
ncbi:MAG: redox-regulated ATPase YchF [Candidatus Omnitrophica bacterium]|nr:redox-regulated ATPase YchF [Candidatus Omnitrophota bacterium]